jgi:predicted metal-binding membrane protein
MGVRSGGWCIGCTWALMAALFALGVMSLTWMALIAVLVALGSFSIGGLVIRRSP